MPFSMTGFGAAEGPVGGGVLRIEIKSVNHRYLNAALRVPGELADFEGEIRDRLRRDFERGHFAISVKWVEEPEAKAALVIDHEKARLVHNRLVDLKDLLGLTSEISLELIARQPEVFVVQGGTEPVEWGQIEPVLANAIRQCLELRRREGAVLAVDLSGRLGAIRRAADSIGGRAPERLVRERDRLRNAVSQLLDGRQVDEGRLAQEIAFLADRLDISEELVRLNAHLDAALAALGQDRPVGKQLGFLAQELGREINTIGSKANDAEIQHLVIEMKGELEKFREQLENLE